MMSEIHLQVLHDLPEPVQAALHVPELHTPLGKFQAMVVTVVMYVLQNSHVPLPNLTRWVDIDRFRNCCGQFEVEILP